MTAATATYIDEIYHRLDRRWNAPSPVLQYAHRRKFEKILSLIDPNETLLDIGRGGSVDGVLGVLAATKGAKVTIANAADEYLTSIRRFARQHGVEDKITFVQNNPQTGNMFADNSFDTVVSLHVLEHLPSFDEGVKTLHRISRKRVIVALPTCLNPCVWIRFGGQSCYRLSFKSVTALFVGIGMVARALLGKREGVIENMTEDSGNKCAHLWRFPWKMRRAFTERGFNISKFGPDTMCLPWFDCLLPISKGLDKIGYWPILRNWGYGSHIILEKRL